LSPFLAGLPLLPLEGFETAGLAAAVLGSGFLPIKEIEKLA